jgi:hypothetical protein
VISFHAVDDKERRINALAEVTVPIPHDQFLCFPNALTNPYGVDYIVIRDRDGNELQRWGSQEWAEDPEHVMGAIMGALTKGLTA